MAKMSKIAKDIKNQPKLKKALATYIANNTKVTDITDLLINGHRGFLAMSEKELTKLFDDKYDEMNNSLKELDEKAAEASKAYLKHGYLNQKKSIEQQLKEANELYDSLFEQLFL